MGHVVYVLKRITLISSIQKLLYLPEKKNMTAGQRITFDGILPKKTPWIITYFPFKTFQQLPFLTRKNDISKQHM